MSLALYHAVLQRPPCLPPYPLATVLSDRPLLSPECVAGGAPALNPAPQPAGQYTFQRLHHLCV